MFRLLLLVAFQLAVCYGQVDPNMDMEMFLECFGNLSIAITPDSEGEVMIDNLVAICEVEACGALGPQFQLSCLQDKDGEYCIKEFSTNPMFQSMFATNQTEDSDNNMDPDDIAGMVAWACSDCGKQLMALMSAMGGPGTDAPGHDHGDGDDHGHDHGDDGHDHDHDAPDTNIDMDKICIVVDGQQCAPKFADMITVTSKIHGGDDHGHDHGDDGHDHGDGDDDGHDHDDDSLPELTPELIEALKDDVDAVCNPCITKYMENGAIPDDEKVLLTGVCAALTPTAPTAPPTVTSNSVPTSIALAFLISIPFLKELF